MRIGFEVTPLLAAPPYAGRSGVGTYAINLLEHLKRLSAHEILPLAHVLGRIDPLQNWNTPSIAQKRTGSIRLNKTVWMQAVLPWVLLHRDIDICHFTNGVVSLWTPCPAVVTIHDLTLWLFPQYHYSRRILAMRPFISLAARRATAIIAVSQATKADITRILGVEECKVHVIHEAPSPHFRRLSSDAVLQAARQSYDLPGRFLLYVGTIEPRKNLVRLLEAFARLQKVESRRYTLVFAGGRGWKDEAVFAAVERLELGPFVRFLGYIPAQDLVALYNLADALAFPSLYEGFGLPIVEAMACGTPVVTSPNGSLREVAGDAAEFVDPTAVDSITDGLRRVLSDPSRRAELRSLGLERAAAFTWERAAQKTLNLYKDTYAATTS